MHLGLNASLTMLLKNVSKPFFEKNGRFVEF